MVAGKKSRTAGDRITGEMRFRLIRTVNQLKHPRTYLKISERWRDKAEMGEKAQFTRE